jgi:hypothetical protein
MVKAFRREHAVGLSLQAGAIDGQILIGRVSCSTCRVKRPSCSSSAIAFLNTGLSVGLDVRCLCTLWNILLSIFQYL